MIALKLAKREIKNNLRYWLFFALNLTIGLIGFTFIFLFRENVNNALSGRAKTLLSSDIAITGRRLLNDTERPLVQKYLNDKIVKQTDLTELYSMARSGKKGEERSRLTLIKAISGEFPLIGEIKLESGAIFSLDFISKLEAHPRVVISPEISHQFKIKIGDYLSLGAQNFEVFGVIKSDSTSAMRGVSLAPKVYIGKSFLKSTELISFGTISWYTQFYNLKMSTDIDTAQKELQQFISDPAIKIKTPSNSSEQLSRVINYLTDYLGLIGVVALLISSVGGSYLFQSYIFDRLKQIGILKSLGVSRRNIILSFVYIILFFGVLSAGLALGFSKVLLPFALVYLNEWMTGSFASMISLEVVIAIISIGILVNLLICPPILIQIFKNKTIDLLSGELKAKTSIRDGIMYIPSIVFLWGISVWQANSILVGSVFTLSLLFIFGIVLLVLPILLRTVSNFLIGRKLSFPYSLNMGFALRILARNKLSTVLTILCLAVGISLVSVIAQIDKSLKSELTESKTPKPSLFLFDIQEEQYKDLKAFAAKENYPLLDPTPMVRARLIKKNGIKIKRQSKEEGFSTREEDTARRFNNRGVNLSYSAGLNSSEEMIKGEPFSGPYSGEGLAEVSLEKRYAQRLKVDVGDTLTYEILGVEVQAKIVNLRKIKWTSFLPNFFITFQPGVIEDAPKTYLTAVEKVSFEKQLEIQDKIVDKFSNISILNVTTVISKILKMFKAMAWAIGVMSFCCICVGLFVLYSILQSQIHKKQKDLALQKLMGMNERQIFRTLFNEYFSMVFSSLLIGNSIGLIISIVVSHLFLDGIFILNWEFFIIFNTGILVMTLAIIFLSFKNNYKRSVSDLFLD
ncbi:MAG: putative ABC transport system permease protein [Bacteriovoracaceae bacterium]|jgi:putative ABC transport system permease protein